MNIKLNKIEIEQEWDEGGCEMFLLGLDLNCPNCGVLVKSGEHHSCKQAKPKKKKKVGA